MSQGEDLTNFPTYLIRKEDTEVVPYLHSNKGIKITTKTEELYDENQVFVIEGSDVSSNWSVPSCMWGGQKNSCKKISNLKKKPCVSVNTQTRKSENSNAYVVFR